MPNVQQPKRAPEFVNGKSNTVLNVVPAQLFAVNWVDANGQKSSALVIHFGHDTEDNAPGVYVLADENEMATQLKIPNATIKKGVRAYLARQKEPTADEIPESATSLGAPAKRPAKAKAAVDLGQMDEAPAAGEVDITKLDIG